MADDYGAAQLDGLKRAIAAVAIFALLALWFTGGFPAALLRTVRRPTPDQPGPEDSRAGPAERAELRSGFVNAGADRLGVEDARDRREVAARARADRLGLGLGLIGLSLCPFGLVLGGVYAVGRLGGGLLGLVDRLLGLLLGRVGRALDLVDLLSELAEALLHVLGSTARGLADLTGNVLLLRELLLLSGDLRFLVIVVRLLD